MQLAAAHDAEGAFPEEAISSQVDGKIGLGDDHKARSGALAECGKSVAENDTHPWGLARDVLHADGARRRLVFAEPSREACDTKRVTTSSGGRIDSGFRKTTKAHRTVDFQ